SFPVILPDGDGGLFIAWSETISLQPTYLGVSLVQRLDALGRPHWSRPAVITRGDYGDFVSASLAPDGEGGVYVSFWEPRSDEAGIVLPAPDTVDPIEIGTARSADALVAPDGSIYVTWEESRAYAYKAILARRLEHDGRLPWPAPVTAVVHNGGMRLHRQGVLADGTLAIVWEDFRTADDLDPLE